MRFSLLCVEISWERKTVIVFRGLCHKLQTESEKNKDIRYVRDLYYIIFQVFAFVVEVKGAKQFFVKVRYLIDTYFVSSLKMEVKPEK